MFYLTLNFNSDAIFVFPRVDLHNKILISSQNSDLEKSASSTARPKFQRPRGRPRRVLSSSKSVCDLPIGSHSCDNRRRGIWKGFRIRAHPSVPFLSDPSVQKELNAWSSFSITQHDMMWKGVSLHTSRD